MKRLILIISLLVALPVYAVEIIAVHNKGSVLNNPYQIAQWGTIVTPDPGGLLFSWYAYNDSTGQAEDTLSIIGVGGINWSMADTSRAMLDSIPQGEDLRGKYIINGEIFDVLPDSLREDY